jgi:hypothetical protein
MSDKTRAERWNKLRILLEKDPALKGVNVPDKPDPADYIGLAPAQVADYLAHVRQVLAAAGHKAEKPKDLEV